MTRAIVAIIRSGRILFQILPINDLSPKERGYWQAALRDLKAGELKLLEESIKQAWANSISIRGDCTVQNWTWPF